MRVAQARFREGSDHWEAWYNLVREDGTQIFADIKCTGTAEAVAQAAGNREVVEARHNRGQALALRFAKEAQSGRGVCTITVSFDSVGDGSPQARYDYEKPVP